MGPAGAETLARYVHSDGDPDTVVGDLVAICQHTFAGDTAAMCAVPLAHDWSGLNPAGNRPVSSALHVAGVGYAYPDSGPVLPLPADLAGAPTGPRRYAYLIRTTRWWRSSPRTAASGVRWASIPSPTAQP